MYHSLFRYKVLDKVSPGNITSSYYDRQARVNTVCQYEDECRVHSASLSYVHLREVAYAACVAYLSPLISQIVTEAAQFLCVNDILVQSVKLMMAPAKRGPANGMIRKEV